MLMEKLILVKPDLSYKEKYLVMIHEWESFGGRINPGLLRNGGRDYETWLSWLEDNSHKESCPVGDVPQTLYFLINGDNKLLGAASIRHYLDVTNIREGGHTGYGIRPSCRRKGYGRQMLELVIEKLNERGISSILITCDSDNEGSVGVILGNGGIFENEIINEEGVRESRYWIGREKKERAFRRLTAEDHDLVMAMEGSFREGFICRENGLAFLENPMNWLFACTQDGRVIGFAYGYELNRLNNIGNMLYIHEVGVLKEFHWQGVGRCTSP
jgi:predicted acetyltransferase